MTTQPNSSVSYDSSPLSTRDLRRALPARWHRLLGVAVALMVAVPGVALAQSPRRPIVELGAQVSKTTSDSGLVGQGLRLTLPLKRRAAIEATADSQKSFDFKREFYGGTRTSAKEFSGHWRQTVFDQPAQSTPPPAAWRRVKPGREVWVTTNTGSLVHGKVAAISDSSLKIREQDREVTIQLDDVRLVEGRDSKMNGLAIGGTSAALAGGLLFARLATELCEGGQECGGDTGGAFLFGAASGFAVGGLLGMMVDGFIPGRQTLVGGSTTVVTPVITPTNKAIDVAIRWR